MILEQIYLGCLSHASYLVADETSGVAAVVDPRRDVDVYLARAADLGVRIEHVLLTHFHADFVSGHLELRERCGATIHMGAQATAAYDFVPHADGDELVLGNVRLQFVETPGHTPESVCVLAFDPETDPHTPHAVFTGDTLFVGDVGRPDLMAALGYAAADLAACLYDSLHEKLLRLPDATLVYPAHGAGSLCGKNLGKENVSTIGAQRAFNPALQAMSREDFVRLVCADPPEQPAYFAYDVELNRSRHATLEAVLHQALRPLTLETVLRLQHKGAQILDVRSEDDYASAHLIGSTHVGLKGQFATWCGTVLDRGRPIVLVADPDHEREAAMRLGRIGFDHVAGFLDGGIAVVEERPDALRHTPRISARALGERLTGSDPPHVLDVRTAREWEDKHLVGSIHVPLQALRSRLDEVPRNSNFVVHCASGYRSAIAASILEQHGFMNFSELTGGYLAWDLTEVR
jgi:glyoxylase-like metal-dependent hydrolase (beta-lactamase superfamily II)/rhodanese-related sulfurtransferase